MSPITDLAALSSAVPRGATVAIGGFQLNRVPVALLRAIVARGTGELAALAAPNPLALELLAAGGALRAADCGFIGFQYEHGFLIPPALRRAVAEGAIELRQRDVHDTITTLRRAAEGEPVADFALLHAQRADDDGNLEIDDPHLDALLAAASRRVLATVEERVERVTRPSVPAARVAGVAVVPGGAAPGACFGFYGRDAAHLDRLLGRSPRRQPAEGDARRRHERTDAFILRLARQVKDGEVIVTGLASALPMLAIAVARRTHAPEARYINCIGAVNPRLDRFWPTSVEAELLRDCEDTIGLADLFDLADAGGVDAMIFGAAQVDAGGNINLERIGPAEAPTVRLPGPAGSPSMRRWVRRVIIAVPHQSSRNLVAEVDCVTSAPAARNRETILVTDLAAWRLADGHFVAHRRSPDVDATTLAAATGFPNAARTVGEVPDDSPPSERELAALHEIDPDGLRHGLLEARTANRNRQSEVVPHER